MIEGNIVLAVTLARGGSVSIPKKNITPLLGVPLIKYTIEEAQKSQFIDRYVISTDDHDIELVANQCGVEIVHRPSALSTNTTSSADALIHAVSCLPPMHYIVEIMATNPLKTVHDIDGCIQKLWKTRADSVVSVTRIYDHHPSRVKWIDNDKMHDFYPETPESRRQDLEPAAYVRNGSVYATTTASLKKHHQRLGPDTRPYIMPPERSINIDEPIDLIVAEHIIRQRT